MRTPSLGSGGGSRRSSYSRTFDIADEEEEDDEELGRRDRYGVGGAMLPIFLNDLRHNNPQDLVEVTLELNNDSNSIVLCSVNTPTSTAAAMKNSPTSFLERSVSATTSRLRRKFPWLRSASSRTSSSETEETTRMKISARDARRIKAKLERSSSSAQRALKGLRFISKTTTGSSSNEEQWKNVESRFDLLAKDGLLCRQQFGACIGMDDCSKEFAVGIFDALARRRRQKIGKITKEELYEFWLQVSDQSFDARLQIFFDM